MAEVLSLLSSTATLGLLVGFGLRYYGEWARSVNAAKEEMLLLIDEAKNTRHALSPIDTYAKGEYVTEDERTMLLASIGRLRSLNARLNYEMMSQLDNRVRHHCWDEN
jgi:hypothetical protein